jgi:hypothetical protein
MSTLQQLIATGRIVDLMLVCVIAEILIIVIYWKRTGRGIATRPLLLNAGAGISLMLSLRVCLTDGDWTWVAVFLLAALVFHVADLGQRWSRAPGSGV